jgi:hypothetical protein
MKKSARIFVSLMSLLLFMICLPGVAAAEEQICPPATVEGTVCPDLQNGIVINLQESSEARSSLIKQWNCAIIDNSNGNVAISGETITYETVDYLDVQVYLQRWNGADWVDVTSRTYSNSSSSYVSGSDIISVSRGYSYRCRAIHTAQTAGSSNSTKTSVSSAIWVQ